MAIIVHRYDIYRGMAVIYTMPLYSFAVSINFILLLSSINKHSKEKPVFYFRDRLRSAVIGISHVLVAIATNAICKDDDMSEKQLGNDTITTPNDLDVVLKDGKLNDISDQSNQTLPQIDKTFIS